jgi:hypothetical protein
MPLVFVHGVNTRKDDHYQVSETLRNGYFREIALRDVVHNPADVAIENPYWGDDGAWMAWGNACLPLEENETFGGGAEEVYDEILSELAPDVVASSKKLLLTLAHKDLVRAVDCLWAAAARAPAAADDAQALKAMIVMGRKAVGYTSSEPDLGWISEVHDDNAFTDRLLTEVDAWTPNAAAARTAASGVGGAGDESFGAAEVWNRIKGGLARLGQATKGGITDTAKGVGAATADIGLAAAGGVINPIVKKARPGAHKRVCLFLGDVFAYLNNRDARAPIVEKVAGALDKANKGRRPPADPLIVVAHSMGGNIVYDILTRLRAELVCDVFVTVGSQVGAFAELGLFPSIPIDRQVSPAERPLVTRPINIRRWINIFDPADVLAYSADRIFAGVEDYAFSSQVTALTAHSMYFERPHFYERLRDRILHFRQPG